MFIVRNRGFTIADSHLIGAAERSPDKVSADPDAAKKLNVQATSSIAQTCASRGTFMIYISTDYVFPGVKGQAPYEVDAPTAPTNLYGQTKLDGEKATLDAAKEKSVILRVPILYGSADKNADSSINALVDAVWKAQQQDADISMDNWAQRCPTNTEDVGRVIKDIAEKYTSDNNGDLPQILQFSSKDTYTKYEICQIFADILGLPLDSMHPNEQGNDPGSTTQRPYDTRLSTKALEKLDIPIWTQNFVDWW